MSESPADDPSAAQWFDELCDGNSVAAVQLWELYFQRMVMAARRKMDGVRRTDRDEEDIALSAFKSFCIGVREGRIQRRTDEVNLWPLLLRLTLNKAVDQIRRSNRKKRGGSGEEGSDESVKKSAVSVEELMGKEPSPEMAAAATESFDFLLQTLQATGDDELQPIALASFEGNSPAEIAQEMKCSVRTVQRKLKSIYMIWESSQTP